MHAMTSYTGSCFNCGSFAAVTSSAYNALILDTALVAVSILISPTCH